jgi:DNA helicase II / ATP-dependent DNA helicase PcrA
VPAARTAPASLNDRPGEQPPAGAFLERAEVRDVLAWLRLLVDPQDAAAVVRALARPPIELRQVDLARVIQVARRRKLDLVSGLTAATEAPQVPPEARERIQRFAELHRSAAAELDTAQPDVFVGRLIERLGVRGRPLLAPEDAAEQQASLDELRGLAVAFVRRQPRSSTRELARHLAMMVAESQRENRAAGGPEAAHITTAAAGDDGAEAGSETATLEATLHLMREEVLASVARIGGRLGELRLDTDLDISHGVVRYLELLKLAALLQRPAGEDMAEALADINVRLLAAATPLQREILQTSTLDDTLLNDPQQAPSTQAGPAPSAGQAPAARADAGEAADAASGEEAARGDRTRAHAIGRSKIGQHGEPSLEPFLPRKGIGLALSASDIETYRSCPLRYKFARVLRIPTGQTLHQRFGIAVHQVLERYHSEGARTLAQMLELLDAGWRRGGFGERERELVLREKAQVALTRYHERLREQDSKPVWFERPFSFTLGPHHLRGRVDRVDRLGDEGKEEYELIDYKTSRPKKAEDLKDDVQLSLYALAAREDWGLESSRQAYYYVLDDLRVPVPGGQESAESVKDTVLEVGEGILAQEFEPTPSHATCSICDYRIVCPAAEG